MFCRDENRYACTRICSRTSFAATIAGRQRSVIVKHTDTYAGNQLRRGRHGRGAGREQYNAGAESHATAIIIASLYCSTALSNASVR